MPVFRGSLGILSYDLSVTRVRDVKPFFQRWRVEEGRRVEAGWEKQKDGSATARETERGAGRAQTVGK